MTKWHMRHAGKLARRVQHHAERLFGADVAGIKNGEIGAAQAEFRKTFGSASGLILVRSTQLRTKPIRFTATPLAIRCSRIWPESI